MAYIQITNRCNMTCEHCHIGCTAEGEDMTAETFAKALEVSLDTDGDSIQIGGGEPTLHPLFWHFLIDAIASDAEYVWLATNGSITKTALKLAKLAKKGIIGCALSQDCYHDPIDYEVVEAFTREDSQGMHSTSAPEDGREVRDVSEGYRSYGGKYVDPTLSLFRDPVEGGDAKHCFGGGANIKPNGDVYICGCRNSLKIGDIFNGFEIPENEDGDRIDCYRELEEN